MVTSKNNINALASAAHVLKSFAAEKFADATKSEDELRNYIHNAAVVLSEAITEHFDRGDMSADEWDAAASLEDYNQEEQAVIANVAKES